MPDRKEQINPYQSPADTSEPISPLRPGRGPMPASVVVAATLATLMIPFNAFTVVVSVTRGTMVVAMLLIMGLEIGLPCLILAGIVTGHRLAWRWGRILTIFAAVIMSLSMVSSLMIDPAPFQQQPHFHIVLTLFSLVVVVGPLLVVFVAFGRPKARAFFGLICPRCGVPTNKADDFFFNKARCRKCGGVWR
jgi:hypothetical protein